MPAEIGLKTGMNWTRQLLREWIKHKFNIEYADTGVLNLLHWGLVIRARPAFMPINISVLKLHLRYGYEKKKNPLANSLKDFSSLFKQS
ncbi:hypothetical protein JFL43_08235 [Viridibacillus sp. YIM B01967]|uniref:Uncharacterized protein n=1 Tax=Viridibacillus soli TaxID=2798301 RepID=A0ABS1H6S7_9BACL|nr:hypothetical protein [Viridibacillus soli]MBK3494847.1 hypothetical protein [Viridibacillus soli]